MDSISDTLKNTGTYLKNGVKSSYDFVGNVIFNKEYENYRIIGNLLMNILIIFALIVLIMYLFRHMDKFTNVENSAYSNIDETAELMDYNGGKPIGNVLEENLTGYGASNDHGVQKISLNNNGDSRMYKWSENTPENVMMSDAELKSKYENMYMLGSKEIQENSLSNVTYSQNCCPNQYMPQFLQDKKVNNCSFANKYIANNYSGQNIDGSGCACMTPKTAEFIVTRGGNTTN